MANLLELTDSNFEEEIQKANVPVLVDFWAVWCGPCKMVAPVVEELANEYGDQLKVGKVDVDKNRDVAMKYGIRSIPTLLIFNDGQVVEQVIGAVSKSHLVDKLQRHMPNS